MTNLVLFSSANEKGNTAKLVEQVTKVCSCEVINLDKLFISPYNYQNDYPEDDFYNLVDKMLEADTIVFASPVYWSAPTAHMKNFIDRLTELLDVAELKVKARALENKTAMVLTTSASNYVSPVFYDFFKALFDYFHIQFKACIHANGSDLQLSTASLALFSTKQQ